MDVPRHLRQASMASTYRFAQVCGEPMNKIVLIETDGRTKDAEFTLLLTIEGSL